jgi:hypothetical protein
LSFCDNETIPDEEYQRLILKNHLRAKGISWPSTKNARADPNKIFISEGPNINIKVPRKSYSTVEEKQFFYKKITIKKKTEVRV